MREIVTFSRFFLVYTSSFQYPLYKSNVYQGVPTCKLKSCHIHAIHEQFFYYYTF